MAIEPLGQFGQCLVAARADIVEDQGHVARDIAVALAPVGHESAECALEIGRGCSAAASGSSLVSGNQRAEALDQRADALDRS
jgi:hypothetical protein